jgi:hypothetical protein
MAYIVVFINILASYSSIQIYRFIFYKEILIEVAESTTPTQEYEPLAVGLGTTIERLIF